jgi:dienelactone hydrolase
VDLNKRRFPTKFAAVILRTAAVLLPLAVAQGTAKAQCAAELPVGYKLMDIAGRKVAVWYPSAVPDSRYQYPGRAGVVGSVALNAAPNECGRFPLLAFSHGVNGCATQSIFLTESLARRGYVVAAPDHADATCSADGSRSGNEATSLSEFRDPETWTDQKYADRKNDIQALITALVSDAVLGRVINAEAIGGVGHSLGGYTIMGMAGGWPSWKDRRLRAVALLSPFADPFMVSGRSPQIDIPVMYQGGTTDLLITPSLERPNGAYDRSPPPKFLSKYTGGHLLWTNVSCMNMPVAQCVNSPGDAQAVTEDITAFLDRYLKGRETPNLFQPRLSASRVGYRRNSATASASAASFARIPVAPESWVSSHRRCRCPRHWPASPS